jgi:2-succinyl-6-hydroxy-2,4-cyclohexadiene-1-carboxylate synthase
LIISTSGVKINVAYFPSAEKETVFVFLLHGFTGSSNDWSEIIPNLNKKFSYVAVDLIGHGLSDSPKGLEHYKTPSLITQLNDIFKHFTKERLILIGYSMGGRAALSYAVDFPEKLAGLSLESSSAGIADQKLRQERILHDEQVIEILENKSLEEFFKFWMSQDLFVTLNSISEEKLLKAKAEKLLNNKIGLINSLRGFGTGVIPALYDKLHLIDCKTLLITGEIDKKFTQINSELVNLFPSAKHVVLKNAGHNVHFEKSEEFGRVVNKFLERVLEN